MEDARTVLKVGEEVEAKFTNVDRKTPHDRAVDQGEGDSRRSGSGTGYRAGESPSTGTSLGDLLKEHIGGQDDQPGTPDRHSGVRRQPQGDGSWPSPCLPTAFVEEQQRA